jgi:hypothetical protein
MQVDFIVHPEQPGYRPKHIYGLYESSIDDVIRSSEFPILVMDGSEKHFRQLVPEANRFSSVMVENDPRLHQYTGHVPREEMPRLRDLLGDFKSHKAVVHGAYFGRCTSHLALQLFFDFFHGKEIYVHEIGTTNEYGNMMRAHEVSGAFVRSNIRWGKVLNSFLGPGISRPGSRGLRFGNLTYQMIGRDTVIYSPGEVFVPEQAFAAQE